MCAYAMISVWLPTRVTSAAFHGAAADGDALANLVVVADLQPRRLAFVGNILRRHADGAERKEGVVGADFRGPFDRHVRHQTAALAQFDLGANHAIRTDLARCRNFCPRIDDGGGMNTHDRVVESSGD